MCLPSLALCKHMTGLDGVKSHMHYCFCGCSFTNVTPLQYLEAAARAALSGNDGLSEPDCSRGGHRKFGSYIEWPE
jgi:hypothetical protein